MGMQFSVPWIREMYKQLVLNIDPTLAAPPSNEMEVQDVLTLEAGESTVALTPVKSKPADADKENTPPSRKRPLALANDRGDAVQNDADCKRRRRSQSNGEGTRIRTPYGSLFCPGSKRKRPRDSEPTGLPPLAPKKRKTSGDALIRVSGDL